MPQIMKRRSSRSRKSRTSVNVSPMRWVSFKELAPAAVTYNGPIRWTAELKQQDLHTFVLSTDGNFSSDGTGGFTTVVGSCSGSPGSGFGAGAGWSHLIATFDEYRVLGFEIRYVPYDRYNRGTTVYTVPVVCVHDYDNSSALTSYGDADSYASMRMLSLDTPWKVKITMSGIENSLFINSTTNTSFYWLKFFGSGATASTAYGHVFITYRVQFRGRGL